MNGVGPTLALNNVLARLRKVRKCHHKADTWHALCPGHDDKNRSLSVWLGRSAVLIGCWAGCDKPRILSAMGLSMRDLFPDTRDDRKSAYPGATARTETRREVACYDYRDEEGNVLYQVVRFEPKGFAQRRPDPERPGKWLWGLVDSRRVLYKLPELLRRVRDGILIVEGEKDVENLAAWDLLATCNVGGAGMGWKNEYSLCLRGRRVVIVPDNDVAGHEHADYVAGSLIRHGAASVRYLTLPDLPEHGDVSWWMAKGGTKEELIRLIKAAPEWCAKQT